MEITVGMFAQICVIILCACAASLTLLDWHLSKKTVHTSARVVDFKGDRVFAQPDKTFVLDTATFILAVEDIQRVADVDEGHCQTNLNRPAKDAGSRRSRGELPPLGQGGRAVLLEDVAAIEVAFVIEMIVDRGVDGGEFLQGLYVPELRHRPLSSSKRLV